MADVHSPESAARVILSLFQRINGHPGEAVLAGALGQLAVEGALPSDMIDDGLHYGMEQGWFEPGPNGAVRLTEAGFALISGRPAE